MLIGHPCRLTGEVLAESLGRADDFAAVRLVRGLEDLSAAAQAWQPDIVLLAGVTTSVEFSLARQIADTLSCNVVVVATEPSHAIVDAALRQGRISLLSHHASLIHLIHTIRGAAMGCATIESSFAPTESGSHSCPLTPREQEVLLLTSDGHPIKEIASRLCLTAGTVRNVCSAAIKKSGARNRHEAARVARTKGWL